MTTFNTGLNKMFNYAFNGWRDGAVGLVPTKDLELLVDPGATLGVGDGNKKKQELLGPNLVSNGDFHDFTMEDDANSIGHYIFDESYTEEDGLESICSERSGSEVENINADMEVDTNEDGLSDDWYAAGSNGTWSLVTNTGFTGYAQRSYAPTTTNTYLTMGVTLEIGKTYKYTVKYRSNNGVGIYVFGEGISTNRSGNTTVQTYEKYFTAATTGLVNAIRFYVRSTSGTAQAGDWIEIDDVILTELPANSLIPSGFSDDFTDEYIAGLGDDLADATYTKAPIESVSKWSPYGNNTVAIDEGSALISFVDNSSGAVAYFSAAGLLDTAMVVGREYRITFTAKQVGGVNMQMYDGTDFTVISTVGTDWTTITHDMTPTSASSAYMRNQSMAGSDKIWIKDIYIQELVESPMYEDGGAIRFNGVDQYLNGGDIHNIGTGNFSIEAWIKCADYSNGGTQSILGKYEDIDNRYSFHINSTGLLSIHARILGSYSVQANVTTNVFTDGDWHHVAVSVDRGTSLNIYVDSVDQTITTSVNDATDVDNTGNLLVGTFDQSICFDGHIAEVRISDVARTATQIQSSYGCARDFKFANNNFSTNQNWKQRTDGTGTSSYARGTFVGIAEIGSLYKMTYKVRTENSSGLSRAYFRGINSSTYFSTPNKYYPTETLVTFYFQSDDTDLWCYLNNSNARWSEFDDVTLNKVTNANALTDGFVEDFSLGGAQYGPNLISNGDFHDFTMDDDANTLGHYIFDKSYTAEDGESDIKNDRSGNNLDLTPSGFSADYVDEYTENADNPIYENGGELEFNGTDQYLSGGDILDFGSGDFSVEAWIKCADYSTGTSQVILSKYQSSTDRVWFEVTGTGQLLFHGRSGGSVRVLAESTNATLSNGQWHHVAFTCDRTTALLFYQDGVALTTTESGNNANNLDNTGNFRVGTYQGTILWFNGSISEVRVSDVLRSAKDIAASANHGRDWIHATGTSLEATAERAGGWSQRVTAVDSSGRVCALVTDLVVGEIYKIETTMTIPTGEDICYIDLATLTTGAAWKNVGLTTTNVATQVILYVVAEETSGYIRLGIGTIDDSCIYDNITIQQVTNGNHGYMQNDMEDDQPTHPWAFKFDGVDQYTDHGNIYNHEYTVPRLMCFWFKSPSAVRNILSKMDGSGAPNRGWSIDVNASYEINYVSVNTWGSNYINCNGAALDIANTIWNFGCVVDPGTGDASHIKFYVNGVQDAPTQVTANTLSATILDDQALLTGTRDGGSLFLDGEIGLHALYAFTNGLPSNYETAIIKTIYDNTKGYYIDE